MAFSSISISMWYLFIYMSNLNILGNLTSFTDNCHLQVRTKGTECTIAHLRHAGQREAGTLCKRIGRRTGRKEEEEKED